MLDVLVVGGGNAALCAALVAREAGASVMLLEAAPREWRGGNSMHTRNLRCMHDAPQDVLTDAYPEEEFWQDLLKVTAGKTDEALARLVIRESATVRPWMRRHGVHFQPSLSGTLHLSRTNAFFMGGGKALVNAYYRSAERLGVQVRYEAPVDRIELEDGRFVAAYVKGDQAWLAGWSAVPLTAQGEVAAKDATALKRLYGELLREAPKDRRLDAFEVLTAAGVRKLLGGLPPGGSGDGSMFVAVGAVKGEQFVLLLQKSNAGWRVAGIDR